MSDPPGRENPKGRRWFRAAVEQFASDRRGTFAPPPNRANEKPRRNPKIPDGVFHALTSRKVAALEMKTPEQHLRSGVFEIFCQFFCPRSATGSRGLPCNHRKAPALSPHHNARRRV